MREALINAMIHRDYTNQGRDIKLGVYYDTIKITSPGGFPSSLTADTLLEGRSEVRNKTIARVFKELGYIEQWGSGIQRIKMTCIEHGLVEPLIQEKGDFVDAIFYRPLKGNAKVENLKPAEYGLNSLITADYRRFKRFAPRRNQSFNLFVRPT